MKPALRRLYQGLQIFADYADADISELVSWNVTVTASPDLYKRSVAEHDAEKLEELGWVHNEHSNTWYCPLIDKTG